MRGTLHNLQFLLGGFSGDGGSDYNDSVYANLIKLSKYLVDGDGDFAAGQALPSNTSLVDIIGDFTGAHDGTAADDNIKALLDLIYADTAAIDPATPRLVTKTLVDWSAAAQNLFVVSGGPIRVLSITGIVAATIKNTTMNLSIVAAVTAPSGNVDIASVLDCDQDAVGTLYTLNATFGSALVATTAGIAPNGHADFIMPPGTINMTAGAVEDGSGSIVWRMLYQKLATGSAVAAA